jgi:hypothetical protein
MLNTCEKSIFIFDFSKHQVTVDELNKSILEIKRLRTTSKVTEDLDALHGEISLSTHDTASLTTHELRSILEDVKRNSYELMKTHNVYSIIQTSYLMTR